MAQGTLALGKAERQPAQLVKQQTYWEAVLLKLWRDKLSVFAILLLTFMVTISAAAPWIGDNVLGFSPTKTSLRIRNEPPTWAEEAWPMFQEWTRTCQGESGCEWSLWGPIFRSAFAGLGQCFRAGPGECHWMGTDEAGRDVMTRAVYGGRISLRIGIYVATISMTLGVILGVISGYYAATFIDDIINAVIMTLGSIPLLFLLIILSRIFQPGPEGLAFLIGIFGWMGLSRLIRGQIFSVREREYIIASQAIGNSAWRIMFKHVMPNVSSIIIVSAVFNIAGAIIAEAGLSYLGVGIGPPLPSWGNMMQGSLGNFTNAPWLVITPGIFIFLTTLSIYLLGDGLRDALDPWVKQ
ncbi:MAG TPA: ABC transporter permease [Caldilineaceae bacterium]|nr:ABC transporter permease [Caldilineaceae bacterium]